MRSMMKTLKRTMRNKNIAIPLYVTAGTSALLLLRHFIGPPKNGGHENFRDASAQFDNKQLGSIVPDNKTTGTALTEDKNTNLKQTPLPEEQSKTRHKRDKVIEQLNQSEEETKIPESTLISTIDEITAPAQENKVQCKAITKKGTRCRNRADSSGYCFHHRNMEEEKK